MERFEIRIEQASGWLLLSVDVVPGDDAGGVQHALVEGLTAGDDPYQVPVWLPEWFDEHGHDAELEISVDMARWRRTRKDREVLIAYGVVVRPGR